MSLDFLIGISRRESGCSTLLRPKDVTIVGAYEVIVSPNYYIARLGMLHRNLRILSERAQEYLEGQKRHECYNIA